MLRTIVIALAACLAVNSQSIAAQDSNKSPGQSEYAPGQKAKEPKAKDAKEYAPGQQSKDFNDPKQPGASEYAPGRQGKIRPRQTLTRDSSKKGP